MTGYSPIGPIDMLLKIKGERLLGSYLLLLAHDVVANAEKYMKLVEGFSGTIIIDNSLIELGHPVDSHTMMAACEIVGASFAVLPDKLLDKEGTIEASTTAAREWHNLGLNVAPMIVAQGRNTRECVECVDAIKKELNEEVLIGIPRALVLVEGSRSSLIAALVKKNKDTYIHLLGFSCMFVDDITCARHKNVVGIDSATPMRLGWEGKEIPHPDSDADCAGNVVRAREDFFNQCSSINSMMIYNLGAIRNIINIRR